MKSTYILMEGMSNQELAGEPGWESTKMVPSNHLWGRISQLVLPVSVDIISFCSNKRYINYLWSLKFCVSNGKYRGFSMNRTGIVPRE